MEAYTLLLHIAIPATIVFVISVLTSLMGIGDYDMDTDIDSEDLGNSNYLTIRNFFAFLTMFTWTALACLEYNLHHVLTIFISLGTGIGLVILTTGLYVMMHKLSQKTDSSLQSTIGQEVTVYTPITSFDLGQVSVMINGAMQIVPAGSDENFRTGERGIVVSATNTMVVINRN